MIDSDSDSDYWLVATTPGDSDSGYDSDSAPLACMRGIRRQGYTCNVLLLRLTYGLWEIPERKCVEGLVAASETALRHRIPKTQRFSTQKCSPQ